jgi:hypothetical protein
MKRVPPFVLGYVVVSFLLGAGVGATMDMQAAAIGAGLLVFGALVACLLCYWLVGFEGPWLQLLFVALITNPTFLLAAGVTLHDIECIVGRKRGWDCLGAAIGIVVAGGALVTPLGGLLWRWFRRRSPSSTAP